MLDAQIVKSARGGGGFTATKGEGSDHMFKVLTKGQV